MRVTDAWLKTAASRRRHAAYDVQTQYEGLVVRIHPSGAASFRFRYRRNGLRPWLVIGEYPAVSLKNARDARDLAERELAAGLDPNEEKERRLEQLEQSRRERAEADTVNELVEQFVHRRLLAERWDEETQTWVRDPKSKTKPRKRPVEAAALLGYRLPGAKPRKPKRKSVPTLCSKHGPEKAREITKRQLVALLDEAVDRGAPVMANRIYALFKQLFKFGAAKDLIPASPMAGIEPPGGEEGTRKRKLSPEELKTVWEKLPTAKMSRPTKVALKALAVTAQRRGELTHAVKSHFDLDRAEWTIPVELQKTEDSTTEPAKPHVVPLSDLAVELFRELFELAGDRRWVLPSPQTRKRPDSPYSERALTRAVKKNQKHFGIPHWTPQDLRRTGYSLMTQLGVPLLHVKKVVNHAIDEMDAVYGQHDYLAEKRAALNQLAGYLENLFAGREQKVVPIHKAR